MKIGFIGAGNMAFAIAKGIYDTDKTSSIHIIDPSDERKKIFKAEFNLVTIHSTIKEILTSSEVCFLAVKPQVFPDISEHFSEYSGIMISIMAGTTLSILEKAAPCAQVIRVMPNTPALVGKMAAAYCCGSKTGTDSSVLVRKLLSPIGICLEVTEAEMDSVTALSGSGPAFFAYIYQCFIMSATAMGLSFETAKTLAFATATGTVELLDKKQLSPEELIQMVSSPGGTTVAGRSVLENSEISTIIANTLQKAKKRSEELSK